MEKLNSIVFDKEDQELFLIDDLQLKADAIRYSILPKMDVVINYAINQIDRVFQINVFDDCIVSKSPNFRKSNRKEEIKLNYNFAHVTIGGKRAPQKWLGFKKRDDSVPEIIPFKFGLQLSTEGLMLWLSMGFLTFSAGSYKKIFDFLIEKDEPISQIQKLTRTFEWFSVHRNNWLIVDKKDVFENKLSNKEFDYPMLSDDIPYPIAYNELKLLIDRLTLLYPIFHSYIQIAKGEKIIFEKLIDRANDWLLDQNNIKGDDKYVQSNTGVFDLEKAKTRADSKIKVMPSIRWQVFQRDSWRCVACGHSAEEGRILHVDHIIPRSKGGKDEIDNYQTLCDICNIGKSNKDETDLRTGTMKT
jgi:hypothetical protein